MGIADAIAAILGAIGAGAGPAADFLNDVVALLIGL